MKRFLCWFLGHRLGAMCWVDAWVSKYRGRRHHHRAYSKQCERCGKYVRVHSPLRRDYWGNYGH